VVERQRSRCGADSKRVAEKGPSQSAPAANRKPEALNSATKKNTSGFFIFSFDRLFGCVSLVRSSAEPLFLPLGPAAPRRGRAVLVVASAEAAEWSAQARSVIHVSLDSIAAATVRVASHSYGVQKNAPFQADSETDSGGFGEARLAIGFAVGFACHRGGDVADGFDDRSVGATDRDYRK
jgi:hypothetical protein